jgi:hypothetical protein
VVASQFVDVVAADRDLVVTGESDPASYVRWVCPELPVRRTTAGADAPVLDVHRTGPQSDLGRLLKGLGRLVGGTSRSTPADDVAGRFVCTDPAGILDAALRGRLESWLWAPHGDGRGRSSTRGSRPGRTPRVARWHR